MQPRPEKRFVFSIALILVLAVSGCTQQERWAPAYPEIPKLEIDQMKLIKINEEVLFGTFDPSDRIGMNLPNKDYYYWAFEVYVKNNGNFSLRVAGKEPYGTKLYLTKDENTSYSIDKALWFNPNTVFNESMERFVATSGIMEGYPEFEPNDVKKIVAVLPEFSYWKPIGTQTFSFVLAADLYDVNASYYKYVVLDEFRIATT